MGLITATLYVISVPLGIFNMVSLLFILPPISSYLALNFTGATTFTSLSGVMKETTYGVPVMIGLTVLGIVFKVIGLVTETEREEMHRLWYVCQGLPAQDICIERPQSCYNRFRQVYGMRRLRSKLPAQGNKSQVRSGLRLCRD